MSRAEKLLQQARPHLRLEEEVLCVVQGAYETKIGGNPTVRTGILIASVDRLVLFAKKLTGFELESFPYANISSFERGKSMGGAYVRFFASGNEVRVKWILANAPLDQLVEIVHERAGKQPAVDDSAPRSVESPVIDQIRQLGELHAAGVLTEAEFTAKKSELLARL